MITVILNGYKRSSHFEKQLKAIKNQTLRPKEILFWQNKGDDFDINLTNQTTHASCNKNLGVWARFAFALNAKTEYVCVFDDDTIPGSKWLENCYNTIQEYDGLLGTIGVNFLSDHSYNPATRVGWDNPNEQTEQVDIVGHSWFFKREDLATFWRELPDMNHSTLVGEDMHFSYSIQKYLGLNTYVPPHPKGDIEMWGSTLGWHFGNVRPTSALPGRMQEMNSYYNHLINNGFKIINDK